MENGSRLKGVSAQPLEAQKSGSRGKGSILLLDLPIRRSKVRFEDAETGALPRHHVFA